MRSLRVYGPVTIAVGSLVWTVVAWLQRRPTLSVRIVRFWPVAGGLAVTEAMFIGGALLMASAVVRSASGHRLPNQGLGRLVAIRRHTRDLAEEAVLSRWFGAGFWLNFGGAVGSNLIAIAAILLLAPKSSWGVLIFLGVDLAASVAWRVPAQRARMNKVNRAAN